MGVTVGLPTYGSPLYVNYVPKKNEIVLLWGWGPGSSVGAYASSYTIKTEGAVGGVRQQTIANSPAKKEFGISITNLLGNFHKITLGTLYPASRNTFNTTLSLPLNNVVPL